MEEETVKVCKMCYKEMDSRAKKCPYCHHWQSRLSTVFYTPVFGMLLLIVCFGGLGMLYAQMLAEMWDNGEDFALYKDQVSVTETEMKFGATEYNGATVAVVGKIVNNSNIAWRHMQLEVRFYDSNEKLVDTGHKKKYYWDVPAKGTSTFKMSMPREFAEEQYISFDVHALSAEDTRARW